MKAITLHQPWASLIACGAKTIETRSWQTSYRGPLAIHAAKDEKPSRTFAAQLLADMGGLSVDIPFGAVVATCRLMDCLPIIDPGETPRYGDKPVLIPSLPEFGLRISRPLSHSAHGFTLTKVEDQRPFGDFAPGRWAWLLEDIQPLHPAIPARGRQGLWNWEWALHPPTTQGN